MTLSDPTGHHTAGAAIIAALRGGLVVSCQAYPGEPMRHPETMAQVAESAVRGGAVGVRVQGVSDCAFTLGRVDVPVIGLWKAGVDGVVITPTLRHAQAIRDTGVHVVALDGTRRARPDGLTLARTLELLRAQAPTVVMADCGSLDDALAAHDAGADLIGTTLAGYTGERHRSCGPDLDLVAAIRARLPGAVVAAEGRISTPEQARQAREAGADIVVVGSAITHPTTLTRGFVGALDHRASG